MARPKKGGGSSKTPPAKIARKVADEATVKNLLRRCKTKANEAASATGELREMIANAVEKKHLHAKAFGWIRQLDKMENEKIAEVLDHFDHYRDVAGIDKRAEIRPGPRARRQGGRRRGRAGRG